MQRRREQILKAAVELFNDQGYLGTTVDEIALLADVTKRTVYHHMGSKEHILLEIHSDFIGEGLLKWQAVVEEDGTATELLRRLIEVHVQSLTEHAKEIKVFFEEIKHLNDADRAEIISQRDRYESILEDVISRGIADGEFRELDARVTTLIVLGGLTEIYQWYHTSENLTAEKLTGFLTEMVLDGVHV
jgi:AcrR family transcriptional regulator